MKQSINWILTTIFLAILFCTSFVYFYNQKETNKSSPTAKVEQKSEKPLPEAKLINHNSEILSDEQLRKGKVILIFVSPNCNACLVESNFLKDLIVKRNDVRFYGVTTSGDFHKVLEASEKKFSFPTYFDADSVLAIQLGVTKVPIKIYLEDGIIKKVWGGATVSEDKKSEFINWLENV